jgi:hypothetical protein
MDQQRTETSSQLGKENKLAPGTRLRKRQRTPEEVLVEEDEERWMEIEERVLKKVNSEDGPWGKNVRGKKKA